MLNSYKNYPPGLNRRLKYSQELQEKQIVRPFTRTEILNTIGARSEILNILGTRREYFINFEEQFKEGLLSENLLNNSNIGVFLTINDNNDNNDICSICIDYFTLNSIYRKLVCNHVFHIKCIDKWFINNNKCPVCRNSL